MKRALATEVGFSDSSVEDYRRIGSRLEVSCLLWNHTVAVVVFEDALSVLDRGIGDITDACEVDTGEFLDSTIAYHFEVPPEATERPKRRFRAPHAREAISGVAELREPESAAKGASKQRPEGPLDTRPPFPHHHRHPLLIAKSVEQMGAWGQAEAGTAAAAAESARHHEQGSADPRRPPRHQGWGLRRDVAA